MHRDRSGRFPRAVIAALGAALFATPLARAQTDLADAGILDATSVRPNLLLVVDDSASMGFTFLPDSAGNVDTPVFVPGLGYRVPVSTAKLARAAFKNHLVNRIYYNPEFTYRPPFGADGKRLPDVSYTAAPASGYSYSGGGKFDAPSCDLSRQFHAAWFGSPLEFWNGSTLTAEDRKGMKSCPRTGDPETGTAKAGGGAYPVGGGYYYRYKGSGDPMLDASYERVEMNAESAAQKQNFANWWSYYRTREQTAKAATASAFVALDPITAAGAAVRFRVGLTTINGDSGPRTGPISDGTSERQVRNFDAKAKAEWFKQLFGLVSRGGTPNRIALDRAGKYFRGTLGSNDPVQYACQRHYAILTTDGSFSETNPPAIADQDGVDGGWSRHEDAAWDALSISPTLADIALYYYKTDLRDGANCTGAKDDLGKTYDVCANDSLAPRPSSRDQATHQHMVTYAISIGAPMPETGAQDYRLDYEAASDPANPAYDASSFFARLKRKEAKWPDPGVTPDAFGLVGGKPQTVYDVWHAAVNARGYFYNTTNLDELSRSFNSALTEISAESASASGLGLSGAQLQTTTNDLAFTVEYQAGEWYGNVQARRLDPRTGEVDFSAAALVWDAQKLLDVRVAGTGWDVSRAVVTTKSPGAAVAFRRENLTDEQRATFGADEAAQAAVIAYLRGDRSNEEPRGRALRARAHVLGDIINAEPVAVGAPASPFADSYNPGYSDFRRKYAGRDSASRMVYVAANDGMLHAFQGRTGEERWAYVPSLLLRSGADGGLAALSWSTVDPTQQFSHRMYVDATPTYEDVDCGRTVGAGSSAPAWRSILVGGLGKGGKGYYAIDVTDPGSIPTDAKKAEEWLASRVLWEFTDSQMGYTYGRAHVFKTRAHGWVVAVGSGYNNADGKGRVYVLNACTGRELYRFETGAGSPANPSGLAHLTGFTRNAADYTVEQIYAGDLLGNLWRFDVSTGALDTTSMGAGDTSKWSVTRIATLVDADGNPAPVTTQPQVETFTPSGSPTRWVFVGTGRLLGASDLKDNARRTFFAIKDGDITAPALTSPVRRADLVAVSASATTASMPDSAGGWYIDLGIGERIVVDPQAALNAIVFATLIPDASDPCATSARSRVFARSYDGRQTFLSEGGTPQAFQTFGAAVNKIRFLNTATGELQVRVDVRRPPEPKGGEKSTFLRVNASFPRPVSAGRILWREIVN